MTTIAKEFTKGLWAEIPLFRLVLGLCPALAVTTTAENGLGRRECFIRVENRARLLTSVTSLASTTNCSPALRRRSPGLSRWE